MLMTSSWERQGSVIRVSMWLFLSVSVVLSNKWLVTDMNFKFPAYPAFLATSHMLFGTIAISVLNGLRPTSSLVVTDMTLRKYASIIIPVAVALNTSIICGNEAVAYISITMIQILKGLSPVTVYMMSLFLGITQFSRMITTTLLLISLGIFLASFQSVQTDLYGISAQLIGIVSDSSRLVLMQKIFTSHPFTFDPPTLFYHLAPFCALLGAIITAFTSFPTTLELQNVWAMLLLNCTLTSMLNLAGLFVIQKTSSLTLSLCGISKDIFLITATTLIWKTEIKTLEIIAEVQ
ncbi:Domain of unknown function DUF250 [Penicillium roqueforti FM164]|uniref:Sugar phosphate transporter domain-containing protein n=1 Tax=Penicillium roqueforti (strain FM164) TaxID=1365484 RepID=W6R2W9_PENRF|nr:Domain of unknown function DUF250 [Penicillium roqueforti FM164]